MTEGLTFDLLWVSVCIWLFSFWILKKTLSISVAFFVSLTKVTIPFTYFAFFYDGSWTFLDDITYTVMGSKLLNEGYNPISVLTEYQGLNSLFNIAGGNHILYYWFNLFSQYLFGEHYYSAVFVNVFLTCISGYLLFKISQILGFSRKYTQGLFIFYLLQWELLVWSSFINLKDISVSFLTISILYIIMIFYRTQKKKYLILLLIPLFLLLWLRFYVCFLIMVSWGLWIFFNSKGLKKYWMLFIVIVLIGIMLSFWGLDTITQYQSELNLSPLTIIFGIFRMFLTPQPWSIHPAYTFLLIPSLLQWMFFLPTLFSTYKLWNGSQEIRLLILYMLISFIFLGTFDRLQGPRHRVQLLPIIAWLQFHFLWSFFFIKKQKYIYHKLGKNL
ncbi:MAG: hypothetical protein AB4057_21840 [Crocosphaera sp.]